MNQNDIANLSDQELFDILTSYDVKCGPVTGKLDQDNLYKLFFINYIKKKKKIFL